MRAWVQSPVMEHYHESLGFTGQWNRKDPGLSEKAVSKRAISPEEQHSKWISSTYTLMYVYLLTYKPTTKKFYVSSDFSKWMAREKPKGAGPGAGANVRQEMCPPNKLVAPDSNQHTDTTGQSGHSMILKNPYDIFWYAWAFSFFYFVVVEIGSHSVVQGGLELTMQIRLAWNLW